MTTIRQFNGHGMHGSPTYLSWANMKARCDNPKNTSYPDYGGRGIAYDPRWIDFRNFFADMGERPEGLTLERKENDGPYSKTNCKWATPTEQARNRRNIKRRTEVAIMRDSIHSETLTITQLAQKLGLSRSHVSRHYKEWGFVPLPQFVRPRVLTADAERYLAGQLIRPVPPTPIDEALRLAKEAAAFAERGEAWPPA